VYLSLFCLFLTVMPDLPVFRVRFREEFRKTYGASHPNNKSVSVVSLSYSEIACIASVFSLSLLNEKFLIYLQKHILSNLFVLRYSRCIHFKFSYFIVCTGFYSINCISWGKRIECFDETTVCSQLSYQKVYLECFPGYLMKLLISLYICIYVCLFT
jgi:hypothetical protein